MKRTHLTRMAALIGVVCLLSGCIRITNNNGPAEETTEEQTADEDLIEEVLTPGETAGLTVSEEEEEVIIEEEEVQIAYRLDLGGDGYDAIGTLIGNNLFAVNTDGKWGVIRADGTQVFPVEYDYYATDGKGYFSLSKETAGGYEATLYEYDAAGNSAVQIWINDAYPQMDITAIYPPYMTLGVRDVNADVQILCIEWQRFGPQDFDFYRLVHLTRNNVTQAGYDASTWTGTSDYFPGLFGSDGGIFVSCDGYLRDAGVYYNIIGVDSANRIVFSSDEYDRTIQLLPYAPTDSGYYAGYVITGADGTKRLAYGNVNGRSYASSRMSLFPDEVTVVFRDSSDFYDRAGRGDRIVVGNRDDDCAVFNMASGRMETGFDYSAITLPLYEGLPSVVSGKGDSNRQGHVMIGSIRSDEEARWYDSASAYDNDLKIAVVAENGCIYAVDTDGRRVSEISEDLGVESVRQVGDGQGHIFRVTYGGKTYLCTAAEARP